MAPSEAAWERLGELLTQRRTQLDPRYARRTTFAKERGLNYRVAYEVETNRRHNFGDGTLAVIESAYELVPGSLKRTLNDGPLEPAGRPAVPSAPSADEPESVSPAVADAIASLIALVTPMIDTEIRRARLRLQRQDVSGREAFTNEHEQMIWDLAAGSRSSGGSGPSPPSAPTGCTMRPGPRTRTAATGFRTSQASHVLPG